MTFFEIYTEKVVYSIGKVSLKSINFDIFENCTEKVEFSIGKVSLKLIKVYILVYFHSINRNKAKIVHYNQGEYAFHWYLCH